MRNYSKGLKVAHSPTFLKKSTDADFLPSKSGTLRLGTLRYYRAHPHPEIGDSQEARLSTYIDLKSGFYSKAFLKRAGETFCDFLEVPDRLTFPFKSVANSIAIGNEKRGDSSKIWVNELKVCYEYTGSDALIFCLSEASELDVQPEMGYNAAWLLRFNHIRSFEEKLHEVLNGMGSDWLQSIRPESEINDIDYYAVNKYRSAKFKIVSQFVRYDDPVIYPNGSTQSEKEKLMFRAKFPEFIKDPKYCRQREFRFSARLMNENYVLPISISHLDIPMTSFRPLVYSEVQ